MSERNSIRDRVVDTFKNTIEAFQDNRRNIGLVLGSLGILGSGCTSQEAAPFAHDTITTTTSAPNRYTAVARLMSCAVVSGDNLNATTEAARWQDSPEAIAATAVAIQAELDSNFVVDQYGFKVDKYGVCEVVTTEHAQGLIYIKDPREILRYQESIKAEDRGDIVRDDALIVTMNDEAVEALHQWRLEE